MSPTSQLVVAVAPVAAIAAVSPIMFLNGSAVRSRHGRLGALQFVAGNLLVLLAMGVACMGLLGAAVESFTERQIASRGVDAVLGLLLVGFGVFQLMGRRSAPASAVHSARQRGDFAWGVLGMATNYTSLPLFISVAQRIGTAQLTVGRRLLVLVLASVVVATPAWLPAALAEIRPGHAGVSSRTQLRVATATRVASIAACLLGGAFLVAHAAGVHGVL